MQTYLEKLRARVRYYESKDEEITTNTEREALAWARRALLEYEAFLEENPSQNPSKLRTAIDDAVIYAGNHQLEWGERAEYCFELLEKALAGRGRLSQTHIRLEGDMQIAGEVLGQERVETGPLKFGNDWCGVFIRGDDCGRFLKAFEGCQPNSNAAGVFSELMQLMESSNEDD